MAAQTFYCCQGGDGSTPLVADAAHCWDADDVSTAGNWANPKVSGKIGPGDTVYFMSDGGIITGTNANGVIVIQASGDSGSVITLQGDGSAVLNGENARRGIAAATRDYITINNLEVKNGFATQNLVYFYDCNNITITNCDLHDIPTHGGSATALIGGQGVQWSISHNNIYNTVADHGIYLFQGDSNAATTDVTIEYNYFHDLYPAGIQLNGRTIQFTNIVIRYNLFKNIGWGDVKLDTGDGVNIYGNIFIHTSRLMYEGILLGDDNVGDAHQVNTKIWNNAFYGYFESMIYMNNLHTVGVPCIAEMYNNIFYSLGPATEGGSDQYFINYVVEDAGIAASDYNIYYSTSPQWQRFGEAKDITLGAWQAGSGMDANSLYADPLYDNAPGDILSLAAGSPAKGAGTWWAGFPQGMNPPMVVANFGRNGSIVLKDFANPPDMGAYSYETPNPWVMIYG